MGDHLKNNRDILLIVTVNYILSLLTHFLIRLNRLDSISRNIV